MNKIPHDLPYDDRLARMRKRLQGLQRVAAAINDLYIYGVYPLKGKLLNVRDEGAKKIADNKEICEIKQIIGLEKNFHIKLICLSVRAVPEFAITFLTPEE